MGRRSPAKTGRQDAILSVLNRASCSLNRHSLAATTDVAVEEGGSK